MRDSRIWIRTRKHGDPIDIMKHPIALTLEASPDICDKDLCALIEADSFAFEPLFVVETRECFCEQVH
jgi:hypothetical protein